MNVLLVGAGAVGLVYGRHLQRGGARVAFFVKEKYAEELRGGATMYPLTLRHRDYRPERFEGFEVLTTLDAVASRRWDQVWLCMSSPALRGPWLEPFLEAAADAAALVTLQPGLVDRQYLRERWPEGRLVSGLITFIAWQSPLPGAAEPAQPGLAYWLPPGAPSPFSGPGHLVRGVVDTLRMGGCPAKEADDVSRQAAVGGGGLIPLIAGLEVAGWSLSALTRDPILDTTAAAAREAMRIGAAHFGASAGAAPNLVRGGLLRLVTPFLPRLVPFDLETYLRYHFTKVGDQTEQMLAGYAERGQALGLPTGALQALSARLAEVRSRPAGSSARGSHAAG